MIGTKTCSTCQETKSLDEFWNWAKSPDGKQYNCKVCQKQNPEAKIYARRYNLKKRYGISVEQYDEMFESQDGRCAICGTSGERYLMPVDHNHENGQVRGILCGECNLGLGKFKDDYQLVFKAADYLKRGGPWDFSKESD